MNIIKLPFKAIRRIYYLINKYSSIFISYSYLRSKGVETGFGDVTLLGFPVIIKVQNSRIVLKKGVILNSKSQYNPAGINHPVVLSTLAENAIIEIGVGCGLSGTSICSVKKIVLGDHCAIGANSKIYDTDFHPLDPMLRRDLSNIKDANAAPITIGNDVWLTEGVTVLKGVTIGNAAVIAIGSVVTKNVPSRQLFGGVPARKLRDL